jgi:hypothetical protein
VLAAFYTTYTYQFPSLSTGQIFGIAGLLLAAALFGVFVYLANRS